LGQDKLSGAHRLYIFGFPSPVICARHLDDKYFLGRRKASGIGHIQHVIASTAISGESCPDIVTVYRILTIYGKVTPGPIADIKTDRRQHDVTIAGIGVYVVQNAGIELRLGTPGT